MGKIAGQEPEQRNVLSDQVYEKLLEAILSGQLMPGAVVSEVSLAKRLNVSRTPVHDALRQLAKDGLVEQQPGRRATIAKFSRDDVFDIFEMRKILEPEAARRAATRLDKQSLARLRAAANELAADRDRRDWVARWTDFDADFHDTIARASGSQRLAQDICRYRLLHRGFNKLTTNAEVLQQALEEHFRILDALDHHDARAAGEAMFDHIQEWQAYFVNHFPAQ
jgi:DNA-binding GntR family transcriptional regulator